MIFKRGNVVIVVVVVLLLLLCLMVSVASSLKTMLPTTTTKSRVELFFKSPQDLRERIRFLKAHGITSFNLVNKNQKDTMIQWVDCIRQEFPQADICAHYSLKYNKVARKGLKEHQARLQGFVQDCKADELLIVSGSGKKVAWNTVEALETLANENSNKNNNNKKKKCEGNPIIAAAYNPYFPDETEQTEENNRLLQKLSSSTISKVYLQFGTDLNRLKDALEMLSQHPNQPLLAGSLFLPTKKLIAQQKFRPWNGVFLSPEFLSGPDHATAIVIEMIKLYQRYNVELLWEAPGIRTETDMALVQDLLQSATTAHHLVSEENGRDVAGAKNPATSDSKDSPPSAVIASEKETSNKRQKLVGATRSRTPCIVLFGSHDVRLHDNRMIEAAAEGHSVIIPVFLWANNQGKWGVTGALQVVLKEALRNLESSLESFGLNLVCRNCDGIDGTHELVEIVQETGATSVYWNRGHTPESRAVELAHRRALEAIDVRVHESQSSLLYDPDKIELSSGFHGGHWGTLMPFLKNCKKHHGDPPRPTPYHNTFRLLESAQAPEAWPHSVTVDGLNMAKITGKERWDERILDRFAMTEAAAHEDLQTFFHKGIGRYENDRSRADKEFATSKLSPHLRIGTLSPNELYWRIEDSGLGYKEVKTFSRRLFWRELAYYQLRCFPEMRNVSIRNHYEKMEWISGDEERRRLEAWKRGKTGYPIVDAGMRELYATGWMTQSIRMVVASFLVEYLRVSWVKGCEWFHYTLVDADSAINAMMWQNAGKSGVDQWNFVLSPKTASQDRTGDYTRKWVPELASLPTTALVHRPWEAPDDVLHKSGVILGETYPERIVEDLKAEREKSVSATLSMRRASQDANNDRGYDLIVLPNGKSTAVFTKREYRIDQEGEVLTTIIETKKPTTGNQKRKRRVHPIR